MKRCCIPALAALVILVLGSCVRLSWSRAWTHHPLAPEEIARLAPGETTLQSCLDELGAPLYVWELSGGSYAIAYGWNMGRDWGFNVSIPVAESASAVMDYGSLNLDLHGVVIAFDERDRLLWRREGYLRDIAYGLERRRPASPAVEGEGG